MKAVARTFSPRLHYAWIVAALTFIVLLMAVAVRATPSVLIVPLEDSLGWSRGVISFAISINIILYGLIGPFAAALMQQIGIRRTVLLALTVIATSVALSSQMTQTWQLILTWGLGVGLGSGVTALVLGATIVNRWFSKSQGLVMGFITASTATGNLVFLPFLASIAQHHGWQPVVWITAGAVAVMIPIVALLLPETPASVGLHAYGASIDSPVPTTARGNPITVALNVLGTASKSAGFWLLFASFFVCGASTNGLIGTHLISYCIDHGLPEVTGASLLAAMGVFDLFGTTISGWLSDRYDSRWLLFWYYGLRGLSLIYLPYSGFSLYGLSFFAVFYGLDWIATVPPTLRLTRELFGKENAPIVFGWLLAGHQLGAGAIAFEAGAVRSVLGDYYIPVLLSGGLCIVAALLVLRIGRGTARDGLATATT
ncbi:MAG TPA: MFS transporter [Stellaceae bacterium]|jgi:MFS family permease|nr:MFS transporter [Stellaceae bacterium]